MGWRLPGAKAGARLPPCLRRLSLASEGRTPKEAATVAVARRRGDLLAGGLPSRLRHCTGLRCRIYDTAVAVPRAGERGAWPLDDGLPDPARAIGQACCAADPLPPGTTIKGRLSGSGAGAAEPGRGVKLK
jgi:hypothetical protein